MKPLELSGGEILNERPSSGPFASAKRWLTRWRARRRDAAVPEDRGASFDEIFAEQHGLVWGMLLREGIPPAQAEEMLQEAFVTLLRQTAKGEIRNASALLVTITLHEISNYRSRRRSCPEVGADDQDDAPASRPDPEGQLVLAGRARVVRKVLDSMRADLAELIELIDLDRQTQQAVAIAKNLPLGTVKSRHRAAKDLFRSLAAHELGLAPGGKK
jgi:RNA polymerase sigma-70 factor (ECF subfamily)